VHDSCVSSPAQPLTSPRSARRRPKRPPRWLAADLYKWSEFAHREPLWEATGGGSSRRRPGRPPKLNADVVGKILMAVRAGNYPEVAARWAGVCAATYYRWRKDPRPPYVAFRAALDMADAECEAMVIGNLAKLSRTSTRAAAFLLERRWPEKWAKPRQLPTEAPAVTPTAPPPPRQIEARTFSISELVASHRESAAALRRGNGGL
jgi:transposase